LHKQTTNQRKAKNQSEADAGSASADDHEMISQNGSLITTKVGTVSQAQSTRHAKRYYRDWKTLLASKSAKTYATYKRFILDFIGQHKHLKQQGDTHDYVAVD